MRQRRPKGSCRRRCSDRTVFHLRWLVFERIGPKRGHVVVRWRNRRLQAVIDGLRDHYANARIDVILGMEARGFIFAPALAYALGTGFVPVRKPKKLPAECERIEYDLEYGTDMLEVHKDAIRPGQSVLIVDDVLATGGTARATAKLVEKCGGRVCCLGFDI